jgi:hypothetical protein
MKGIGLVRSRTAELRERAAECAALGARATDPVVRQDFLALARHFESLADKIDGKALRIMMEMAGNKRRED